MAVFKPKYITFDCYGTLINFDMLGAAASRFADRVDPQQMAAFTEDFSRFRLDEVLGAFKLYPQVVASALRRTCKKWDVECTDDDCAAIMTACASWGPHPDVPEGLAKVAEAFPLVLLSNSTDELIKHHVPRLGAPIHMTITAEEVGAYKPQMKGFEYMLDKLECGPEEILHVSSSLRYDLMTAHDLGITHKVFVNRGHGPGNPYYGYSEVQGINDLPAVVGL
ncbi:haloacid dehalogenase type II [Erwinia psidii]|uniref:Haloacid dehalogenase type II n=1 Tax=Erwinia psidii TaxID=69224 RepID=A0A3N6SCA6_9GAMM|nr:haloacid dehalogenase type II [Erwinia psidii]MCX8955751.1 haloacid dehalogenase type II [Erwinia psidii]MCX8961691.1 haloacid dehalogenase type II [Erwinia psidii]MCX8965793.1 haloacid dehalogenase type II [Erwinia psidii]RQM37593.1 haloacid dehalogenase type II [Erwinia psidii]